MTERFTLLSELGRGGMGVVWKARDEETGSIVALKLLRETYAEDPDYVVRFERELELAMRIDSVHVVKVLGYGVRERAPYLALEYVDGPSLSQRLTEHGPYAWDDTKSMLDQMARGLAAAHKRDIVHRDIKSSNVLVGSDGIAKLADFGIARGLDLTRMTATSTILGTPAYLAPEGPADERSDLYSLGIVGFEMLAGAPPFDGKTYQQVVVAHIRQTPDLDRLPAEARPVIGWLLAKDPEERPQCATDLIAVLHGRLLLPGAGVAAGRASEAVRTGPTSAPVTVGLVDGAAQAAIPVVPPNPQQRHAGPPAGRIASSAMRAWRNTTAGRMALPRIWHTATLLGDGRVLIAGGRDGYGTLGEAELYDPRTNTFSAAGPMIKARSDHTATRLADGRVLFVGGPKANTCEIFDPATGAFNPAPDIGAPRMEHTATPLSNGLVLIVGGDSRAGKFGWRHGSVLLYEPTRGVIASLETKVLRESHTATVLFDGRVLVAGGSGDNSAEIYDAPRGGLSSVGHLRIVRRRHTATALRDGRVLIAGGRNPSGSTNSTELFDPYSGTFYPGPPLARRRDSHTATLLADGCVLLVGGGYGPVFPTELFDPGSDRFYEVGSTAMREAPSTTPLPGGTILVAGGRDAAQRVLASAELLQ